MATTPEDAQHHLALLREQEAIADAALVASSAATRANPTDERAAAHHLACADQLAVLARRREQAEEAVLALRWAAGR